MFWLLIDIVATGKIISVSETTASSSVDEFINSPLTGVVIGGLVTGLATWLGLLITNKQQLRRDKEAHKNQMEREKLAYERSIKDAKRERLRNAYKVVFNTAEEYLSVLAQLDSLLEGETKEERNKRLDTSLRKALDGMNEAMIDITLEDVGTNIKTIFSDIKQNFTAYTISMRTNAEFPGTTSLKELTEMKNTARNKMKELTEAMQQNLKELEY